jgi:uncharacterized protein (DUF2236 family)
METLHLPPTSTPVSFEYEKDYVDAISTVHTPAPYTTEHMNDGAPVMTEKAPLNINHDERGKSGAGDSLVDTESSTADTCKHAITQEEFLLPSFQPEQMRKIVQEAILLAGGAVAILLQVADPGVARGVDEHSNFAYRPLDRLRTTLTYVYCMVYGTVEEKKAIISMVHRAHSVVRGEGYSADDPELQLWVSATLYASATEIYEKIFGTLDEATNEEIYREYSILASSLRVPASLWPANRAAFWAYFNHKLETIEVTPYAKNVCRDLLYNKKTPLILKGGMPVLRLMTAEWLPPKLREAYGLKRKPKLYKLILFGMQTFYPGLPSIIRTFPVKYYMRDMRKRMRNAV